MFMSAFVSLDRIVLMEDSHSVNFSTGTSLRLNWMLLEPSEVASEGISV